MSGHRPTALIADDEPLLREGLQRLLAQAWPELNVLALARNGREAVEAFEAQQPDICFLDVHMPGLSGVEAARLIGRRAQLVFVTAYDQYALQAFEQGALDYLVKPVELARLTDTVARLKARVGVQPPSPQTDALLAQLATLLNKSEAPPALRWLRVSVGKTVRLVSVDELDFLRASEKYTQVAWTEAGGQAREGLIRTPLKDLLAQLDPTHFLHVHRAVVVNLRAVSYLTRGPHETATLHLKTRDDVLPVSRAFNHHFRQM